MMHEELKRQQTLARYAILDTAPEPLFDGFASLAAQLVGACMAVISFVDDRRVWFKACHGLSLTERAREDWFCTHVVESGSPLIVVDAQSDLHFGAATSVAGTGPLRFYAGMPLRTPCGHVLGALGVLDLEPRYLNSEHERQLSLLAAQVMLALSLRVAMPAPSSCHARLQATVESALDGIVTIDARGRIEHVNAACEKLFGYRAAELTGQNVSLLVPAAEAGQHDAHLTRYARTGERKIIGIGREVSARRKDGTCFPAELSVTELELRGLRYFVGTLRDISERKRAETALLTAREHALSASRYKSQFLARMSHEIRTPMNGVLGMLSLVLDESLSETHRELLSAAYGSAEELLQIVNAILDVSKIEAGKLELESAPFVLRDVVESALKSCWAKARAKKLNLRSFVAPEVPERVIGDAVRLRQVLINLLGNAVAYTECGSVTVRLGPAQAGMPSQLRFRVDDTGVGIPEERCEAIFEPFTQGDESSTRKYGGTGLGLTICRELVALMGGRLQVTSELHVGSSFHFEISLPLAEPHTEALCTATVQGVPAPLGAVPDAYPLRILVVEDHPVNARLVMEFVRRHGHRTVHAANGERALELLQSNTFDAVLMDVEMPKMDGYEATRRIRERSLRVPIIALTASAMAGDRDRCITAGMNAFLSKPIDRQALCRTLDMIAAGEPLSASAEAPRVGADEHGKILNRAELLLRANGELRFVRDLLRIFECARDESMRVLAQHVERREAGDVRAAAHRLKGALQTISAERATALAAALERAAHAGDQQRCPTLWRALSEAMEELAPEIERLVSGN